MLPGPISLLWVAAVLAFAMAAAIAVSRLAVWSLGLCEDDGLTGSSVPCGDAERTESLRCQMYECSDECLSDQKAGDPWREWCDLGGEG